MWALLIFLESFPAILIVLYSIYNVTEFAQFQSQGDNYVVQCIKIHKTLKKIVTTKHLKIFFLLMIYSLALSHWQQRERMLFTGIKRKTDIYLVHNITKILMPLHTNLSAAHEHHQQN
jgi:hypothetical protein